MPTQRQIEIFTLEFHRVALERLRAQPEQLGKALAVLDRWEAQGLSGGGQVYRDTWRRLLCSGVDDIERNVCADTDQAATIRSMSPLGFLLLPQERLQLRQRVMVL